MKRSMRCSRRYPLWSFILLTLLMLQMPLQAQEEMATAGEKGGGALETLRDLVSLQANLKRDLDALNKQLGDALSLIHI